MSETFGMCAREEICIHVIVRELYVGRQLGRPKERQVEEITACRKERGCRDLRWIKVAHEGSSDAL